MSLLGRGAGLRMCCLSYPGQEHSVKCPTRVKASYQEVSYQEVATEMEGQTGLIYGLCIPKVRQTGVEMMDKNEMDAYVEAVKETIDRVTRDSEDPLAAAIGIVLGSASMAWSNPRGAGVFDSQRAEALIHVLKRWLVARLATENATAAEGSSTVDSGVDDDPSRSE